MDRGGKGLYVGGLEQFVEYAARYHDTHPDTTPSVDTLVASENQETFDLLQLEIHSAPKEDPLTVCVTNASSEVAYHLCEQIATGSVYGKGQKVSLHLYDAEPGTQAALEGVRMELEDMASPVLAEVRVSESLQDAFNSVRAAFVLDYPYQGSQTELLRGDESAAVDSDLQSVVDRYHRYAHTIDFSANKEIHVIVTGCYGNMGTAILGKYVSSIPSSKFVAAPCLAEQQGKSLLAGKLGVNGGDIEQVNPFVCVCVCVTLIACECTSFYAILYFSCLIGFENCCV